MAGPHQDWRGAGAPPGHLRHGGGRRARIRWALPPARALPSPLSFLRHLAHPPLFPSHRQPTPPADVEAKRLGRELNFPESAPSPADSGPDPAQLAEEAAKSRRRRSKLVQNPGGAVRTRKTRILPLWFFCRCGAPRCGVGRVESVHRFLACVSHSVAVVIVVASAQGLGAGVKRGSTADSGPPLQPVPKRRQSAPANALLGDTFEAQVDPPSRPVRLLATRLDSVLL